MSDLIIDVRELSEFAGGHVAKAINIPLTLVDEDILKSSNITKDTNIIVYCNSGNRSGIAKKLLQNLGYTNVINGINKEQVETKLGKNYKN